MSRPADPGAAAAPVGPAGQRPALPARVFVTGANGFIGRAVLARYRALGAQVRGVDVRADPAWDVVPGRNETLGV